MDDFLDFKFNDGRLDHALRCFNYAIRDKALTTLFCFLAIEVLARRVSEIVLGGKIEEVDKKVWDTFKGTLNLKEQTIKSDVKMLSDAFRHGDFVDTSWETRKRSLATTWEIIARTMHLLMNKSQLSKTEFPEL